jgi:hypothetical protein
MHPRTDRELIARTEFSFTPAEIERHRAALARLALATERHTDKAADHAAARDSAADCDRAVAKLQAEHAAWIARETKKHEQWIADGRKGARPQTLADAKPVMALASARASAEASRAAVPRFAAAEAEALAELQAAEAAVHESARAIHRAHAAELIERFAEFRRLADQVRAVVGSTAFAAEMWGIREDFTALLDPHQIDELNSAPRPMDLATLFAPVRHVVDNPDTPVAAEGDLGACLNYWRRRAKALDASALGEQLQTGAPVKTNMEVAA